MKQWQQRIRRKVKEYATWWVKYTGLGYWNIETYYYDDFAQFPEHSKASAFVDADWRYCNACIHISYEACRGLKYRDLEKIVVHELAHVLLNEMRETGVDHEERVATMLQKALFWVKDNADVPLT